MHSMIMHIKLFCGLCESDPGRSESRMDQVRKHCMHAGDGHPVRKPRVVPGGRRQAAPVAATHCGRGSCRRRQCRWCARPLLDSPVTIAVMLPSFTHGLIGVTT